MTTWIKICGVQSVEHVQAAVQASVNAIGFVFARSVRQISPLLALQLSEHVPPHVDTVAVFLRPDQSELDRVLDVFQPNSVQADWSALSGLSMPESIRRIPVCREGGRVNAVPDQDGHGAREMPEPFIYEGGVSGQGETVNWQHAAQLAAKHQLILAGGLSPANVATAINTVKPFGVDVSSGVEQARGIKSAQLMQKFVSEVRNAEHLVCGE